MSRSVMIIESHTFIKQIIWKETAEGYSEPYQTSKMDIFVETANVFWILTHP